MYKQIVNYTAKGIYPFHMPGHKRNPQFIPPNLLDLDLTEIPGMDVLSAPSGIIHDLQQNIARFYGASHSFLLVNGSSAGIIAAVCATCSDGTPLVVPRNAHASVYNAMVLSGANPYYIMPEITEDGLAGGIPPSMFDNIPYGAAVLVVSPTYEGFVSDIAAIADKVHSRKGILIVDEAHGAHFAFSNAFPVSAISLGADIVIQSLHKTLPAPSQCALLHISNYHNTSLDIFRTKFLINAVQTSSPSYILMSVCDYMLRLLWEDSNFFKRYIAKLEEVRAMFPDATSTAALRLSARERVGNNAIFDVDTGKLLFTLHTSIDAKKIAEIMANKYRVQMEMAEGRHILAMTSVADTDEGFARLKAAVDGVNAQFAPLHCGLALESSVPFAIPKVVISPRKAISLPSKEVLWEDATGQVSAQLIAKYPPGIAIVAPGELIPPGIPKQSKYINVIEGYDPK